MYYVLIATVLVGVVGIIIGLLLGLAGVKFKVEVDEREEAVLEVLPGNNCGGCGYAGCAALAKAIAAGEAAVNTCPVGGAPVGEKVAAIMGVEAGDTIKMAAFVKCSGTCDKAEVKFQYFGIDDCQKALVAPGGGAKVCASGCMGYGSCVKACNFDAIHIVNGVAKVNRDKCVSCGKCAEACPKHLIEILPYDAQCKVACSNHGKGKTVKEACAAGCIACGVCVKQCENDAIQLVDNLPVIDLGKCKGCGKCASKCPQKVIV